MTVELSAAGPEGAYAALGRERTDVVGGVPMRWYEAGGRQAPPVVLLHGIPTDPTLWRAVVPLLPGAHVVSVELVGYGRSAGSAGDRDISVQAQAVYVLALLRHLGLSRAVLVGHDIGGGVAQVAAVRDPLRCAGLVVTNGICYDSWPVRPMRVLATLSPLVSRLPGVAVAALVSRAIAGDHPDEAVGAASAALHSAGYREAGGAALAAQARSLDVQDTLRVARELTSLDVPTAVVWGLLDTFQRPVYGRRLAADTQAPFTGLRDVGHWTPEDAPDEVATAVRDVLRRAAGR